MWFRKRRGEQPTDEDKVEREWRRDIAKYGWLVIDVHEDDEEGPGFHFTVGLTEKNLPELILYDVPSKTGGLLLNDVAQRLVAGERLDDGQPLPRVLERGYEPQLWSVVRLQDPLGAAFRLYGRDNVRVRQLVLPDADYRMPWEPDYSMPRQPMLFIGPGGEGPRPSEGRQFLD